MKRTTEFVLGLIGGIFGIRGVLFDIFFGAKLLLVPGLGWGALEFSIIAIVASVVVKSKPKGGGALMLISAIGG